jgi:hypothetical protein
MITQRRADLSGVAQGLHKGTATVIWLSHTPRAYRPTRAEIELETAFRIRLMYIGRAPSVTRDETPAT